MKKYFTLLLFTSSLMGFAQIGIRETTPKTTLDIKASGNQNNVDGVIFPALTLEELTAKGNSTYTANHAGAMVFISDISTGDQLTQRVNINAPGYYYFDGNLWQKVNFGLEKNLYDDNSNLANNRTLNLSGKTLSIKNVTGTPTVNQFSVDGSTFSIDALNNRVGIGTTQPNAKVDIRTNPTSTSDPGLGVMSIGTTSALAEVAGAGAMRYSTLSGGILQFSNGVNWNTLKGNTSKATVVATKTTGQSIARNLPIHVVDWTEVTDNQNTFDPVSGTFTAPRTGNYLMSFSYGLNPANYNSNRIEAQLESSRGAQYTKKNVVCFAGYAGNVIGTANITFVVRLLANERINPVIYVQQNGKSVISTPGYNNFSVSEL